MDHRKWRKLIKDKCFFLYRLTRVKLDKGLLNGLLFCCMAPLWTHKMIFLYMPVATKNCDISISPLLLSLSCPTYQQVHSLVLVAASTLVCTELFFLLNLQLKSMGSSTGQIPYVLPNNGVKHWNRMNAILICLIGWLLLSLGGATTSTAVTLKRTVSSFVKCLDFLWSFIGACVLLGEYPCVQPRTAIDWWRNVWQRRRDCTHSLPRWRSLYNGARETGRCQSQRGASCWPFHFLIYLYFADTPTQSLYRVYNSWKYLKSPGIFSSSWKYWKYPGISLVHLIQRQQWYPVIKHLAPVNCLEDGDDDYGYFSWWLHLLLTGSLMLWINVADQ